MKKTEVERLLIECEDCDYGTVNKLAWFAMEAIKQLGVAHATNKAVGWCDDPCATCVLLAEWEKPDGK